MKNVKVMQRISLYAPNEPKNETIATITPTAISNEAPTTYRLLPNSRLINDRSYKVYTPTAKTTRPPINITRLAANIEYLTPFPIPSTIFAYLVEPLLDQK
jgi:hypothetical protein